MGYQSGVFHSAEKAGTLKSWDSGMSLLWTYNCSAVTITLRVCVCV